MKCDKCGKNASFYFSSNVNGQRTERHLCADCARAEGFGNALDYDPMGGMRNMFDSFFEDFGGFFGGGRSLMPSFDLFGSPMRSMMTRSLPRVNIVVGSPEQAADTAQSAGGVIPDADAAEIRARREKAALRHQLDEAVKAEDFERAASLRDQLRALEK